MWRAFFMAMGISSVILGGEFMVAEKLVMASEVKQQQSNGFFPSVVAKKREVVPPEWAPWGLLSTGTVVILYSLTLPKSGNGAPEGG
jgi:hypothetical protein